MRYLSKVIEIGGVPFTQILEGVTVIAVCPNNQDAETVLSGLRSIEQLEVAKNVIVEFKGKVEKLEEKLSTLVSETAVSMFL